MKQEYLFTEEHIGEKRMIEGVKKVWGNEVAPWKERALEAIVDVAIHNDVFTADDVRDWANDVGLEEPHHPNAWGAAFRVALTSGVMNRTGRYVKSRRPNQNATMIPQYRSNKYQHNY
jgi:hypothetical protein